MASNRHLGRIIALQTLYEQDFRRAAADATFNLDEVLSRNIARYEAMVDDKDFIIRLTHGVSDSIEDLDIKLKPLAPEWPIDQIARMDRVVLRIGLYELGKEADVPPKVVINEAVELAKAFGSDNSSKFINGVLGTALRQKETTKTAKASKTTKTAKPKAAKPKRSPAKAAKTAKSAKSAKPKSTSAKSTKKSPAKPKKDSVA